MSPPSGKLPENASSQISHFVFRFKESSKRFVVEILTQNSAFNLSGALFLVGLGCSLKWWYKDQLVIALLKQNLPALSEPQQRISWETGEYVTREENRQFIGKKSILSNFENTWSSEYPSDQLLADPNNKLTSLKVCVEDPASFLPQRGKKTNELLIGSLKEAQGVDKSFGRLIKRIDLYGNCVVLNFKSPWEKHAYQRFVGVFSEPTQITKCKINSKDIKKCIGPASFASSMHPLRGKTSDSLETYNGISPSERVFLDRNNRETHGTYTKRSVKRDVEKTPKIKTKYTLWKPLVPDTWFKLSARGLCVLNKEFPLPFLQTISRGDKGKTWNCFGEPIERSLTLPVSLQNLTNKKNLESSQFRQNWTIIFKNLVSPLMTQLRKPTSGVSKQRGGKLEKAKAKPTVNSSFGRTSEGGNSSVCILDASTVTESSFTGPISRACEAGPKNSISSLRSAILNTRLGKLRSIIGTPNFLVVNCGTREFDTKNQSVKRVREKNFFTPLVPSGGPFSRMSVKSANYVDKEILFEEEKRHGNVESIVSGQNTFSPAITCGTSEGAREDPASFLPRRGRSSMPASQAQRGKNSGGCGTNPSEIGVSKEDAKVPEQTFWGKSMIGKLSYPLELTTTMAGWQPPIDTLILNSYLDEIPYKLESTLLLPPCKKNTNFSVPSRLNLSKGAQPSVLSSNFMSLPVIRQSQTTLFSDQESLSKPLKEEKLVAKPMGFKGKYDLTGTCIEDAHQGVNILVTDSTSRVSKKRVATSKEGGPEFLTKPAHIVSGDQAKSALDMTAPSETFFKKLQFVEIKQLLKNELQLLVNTLPITFVNQFVPVEYSNVDLLEPKVPQSGKIKDLNLLNNDLLKDPHNSFSEAYNGRNGVTHSSFSCLRLPKVSYSHKSKDSLGFLPPSVVIKGGLENSSFLLNNLDFTFNNLTLLITPPVLLPINNDASFWMWKLPANITYNDRERFQSGKLDNDTIFRLDEKNSTWEILQKPSYDQHLLFFSKAGLTSEDLSQGGKKKNNLKNTINTRLVNCINRTLLKESKTTIAKVDSINPVDKRLFLVNRKSRFMSGYVYPDVQNNLLKTNLYRWISLQQENMSIRDMVKTLSLVLPPRAGASVPGVLIKKSYVSDDITTLMTDPTSGVNQKIAALSKNIEDTHDIPQSERSNEIYWLIDPKPFRRVNRFIDKASLVGVKIPTAPRTFLSNYFGILDSQLLGTFSSASPTLTFKRTTEGDKPRKVQEGVLLLPKNKSSDCLITQNGHGIDPVREKVDSLVVRPKEEIKDCNAVDSNGVSAPEVQLLRALPLTTEGGKKVVNKIQLLPPTGVSQPKGVSNLVESIDSEATEDFTPLPRFRLSSISPFTPFDPKGVGSMSPSVSQLLTKSLAFNHHLAYFPGFTEPNQLFFRQIAKSDDGITSRNVSPSSTSSYADPTSRVSKKKSLLSSEIEDFKDVFLPKSSTSALTSLDIQGRKIAENNKSFLDCSPRKTAYHGIVVQRNKLTKDFQPPKNLVKQSFTWGTAYLGPENPLSDRQCHFFGQRRLSTIDTNIFQRDYLRQLGKETLGQANFKGWSERPITSVERAKILSFSKTVSAFPLKKGKYTYLLEEKDQWHFLFQEQLRTALEDPRKYPPLTAEQAKDHGPGRIKVSAPLIMARFPVKSSYDQWQLLPPTGLAKLSKPLITEGGDKVGVVVLGRQEPAITCGTSEGGKEDPVSFLPRRGRSSLPVSQGQRGKNSGGCGTNLSEAGVSKEDAQVAEQDLWGNKPLLVSRVQLRKPPGVKNDGIWSNKGLKGIWSESLPEIISHYPLFTERDRLELDYVPWLNKSSSPFFNGVNNLQWLTQEPLTVTSWGIISQWCFLVALLSWIEQMLVANVFPALFALEQLLLGATGIKSGDRTHVIRISKGDTPKFKDIAGVDGLLGELAELVLFLRGHKGRLWNKKSSHGVLLTGPPGTGKTYLVRALANEARVPVLILSAGALTANKVNSNKPSWAIRHAFRRAKVLAPCILFIDEIDALGRSRGKIVTDINEIVADTTFGGHTNMGSSDLHSGQNQTTISTSILPYQVGGYEQFEKSWPSVSKPLINEWQSLLKDITFGSNKIDRCSLCEDEIANFWKTSSNEKNSVTIEGATSNDLTNKNKADRERGGNATQRENIKRKFGPLTQLLVSMDGVSNLSGVLIMGATNRPESLDPALTRPGRFERVIRVEKPAEQKRVEILQLYSHNLGVQHEIPWSYLANRTVGLTAADLAVAMNYSSLKAIVQGTMHTIETIEYGLDSITRFVKKTNFSGTKNPNGVGYLPVTPEKLNHASYPKGVTRKVAKGFSSYTDPTSTLTPRKACIEDAKTNELVNEKVTSLSLKPIDSTLTRKASTTQARDSLISPRPTFHRRARRGKLLTDFSIGFAKLVTSQVSDNLDQTTSECSNVSENLKSYQVKRLQRLAEIAFYQAGKIVIQTLLPQHPPVALITLDLSGITTATSADTHIPVDGTFNTQWCSFLESRLIGLYGGKATSFLLESQHALIRSSYRTGYIPTYTSGVTRSTFRINKTGFQSNIGNKEVESATQLATAMVNKWNFYSLESEKLSTLNMCNSISSAASLPLLLHRRCKELTQSSACFSESTSQLRQPTAVVITEGGRKIIDFVSKFKRKPWKSQWTGSLSKSWDPLLVKPKEFQVKKGFLTNQRDKFSWQNSLSVPSLESYLRYLNLSYSKGPHASLGGTTEGGNQSMEDAQESATVYLWNQNDYHGATPASNSKNKSVINYDSKPLTPLRGVFKSSLYNDQHNICYVKDNPSDAERTAFYGTSNVQKSGKEEIKDSRPSFEQENVDFKNSKKFFQPLNSTEGVTLPSSSFNPPGMPTVIPSLSGDLYSLKENFVSHKNALKIDSSEQQMPRFSQLALIAKNVFVGENLRFAFSQSRGSLKVRKKEKSSYSNGRTSVDDVGKRISSYPEGIRNDVFNLVNPLQFSNVQRNRFYPGWFRLYLPDIEATEFMKNVANYYFSLGLQTLTRSSLSEFNLRRDPSAYILYPFRALRGCGTNTNLSFAKVGKEDPASQALRGKKEADPGLQGSCSTILFSDCAPKMQSLRAQGIDFCDSLKFSLLTPSGFPPLVPTSPPPTFSTLSCASSSGYVLCLPQYHSEVKSEGGKKVNSKAWEKRENSWGSNSCEIIDPLGGFKGGYYKEQKLSKTQNYNQASVKQINLVGEISRKKRNKLAQLDAFFSLSLEKQRFPVGSTDLSVIEKECVYPVLINNCFGKAFLLADQNRQLIDYFADYLIRFQILRQHQILYLFSAVLLSCKKQR